MGIPTQEEWVNDRIREFKDIFRNLGDEQLSIITEWISNNLDSAWKRGHKEGYDDGYDRLK